MDGEVPKSPREVCPLLTGSQVPEVTLTTADGRPLNLSGAVKQKPTVLVFYRGGW